MGPELIVAVLGPIMGGAVSVLVWAGKKNNELMREGFMSLTANVASVEKKLDDLRFDVAKNYVSNDVLTAHIKGEEDWHLKFNSELSQMKADISNIRNHQEQ